MALPGLLGKLWCLTGALLQSEPTQGAGAVSLSPQQVCFVVDDVPAAVNFCEQQFAWGPFYQFKAPVANASYKHWKGEKLTEVALGMAGKVQVEFLHIHHGHDTTADYQARYGSGFQHIGIHCTSREDALAHLQSLGASVNELNKYPGVRFAFANTPTGPGMFEILQTTTEMKANTELNASSNTSGNALFQIDRASIVTHDIDKALTFYSGAFGWQAAKAAKATRLYNGKQTTSKRYVGKAGTMELELIQPLEDKDDPYAAHLRRGDHGLIHASGAARTNIIQNESVQGEWLDTGEQFSLHDWVGGKNALQIRRAN